MSKKNVIQHGPKGFVAGGISAGIKSGQRHDLGMIVCERVAVAAATLTTNRFQAAPVLLCKKRLSGISRPIRGLVVNSGNANAMTGKPGLQAAQEMAEAAERAAGCPIGSFLVSSTGIIGKPLPIQTIRAGLPKLAASLSSEGWMDFARAIMTTDLTPKISQRVITTKTEGERTILGVAKGSGMIQPNMATMLAYIVTDFPLPPGKIRQMLRGAVEVSFNCLTVDGQTSTNDTVLLMSSEPLGRGRDLPPASLRAFEEALTEVCQELTKMIAADGEGATKLVEIEIAGTNSPEQARRLAFEVANSPLVKTALHGADPNWGRIIQSIGQSTVPFEPDRVGVSLQGIAVVQDGEPVPFNRDELHRKLESHDVKILVTMGGGKGNCRVWTCDLSADYVKINTAYN